MSSLDLTNGAGEQAGEQEESSPDWGKESKFIKNLFTVWENI